jgi:O-methyltransferase involved in polyketide biosynthesis
MVSYMACRTAFFDQFFVDATRAANAGIRQAVILTSRSLSKPSDQRR